ALKNMMGLSTYDPTLRYFHFGAGGGDWYDNLDHLSQCIADINLVRQPDLIVADATEFLASGGPGGPGRVKKAGQVLASVDPVCVDAYGARLLGYDVRDLPMLAKAEGHGLGQMDLDRVNVSEVRAGG
ncbi:MAG: DUF362 domain-containing protein, partial [Thermodesulfobacteriota bacterium]